MAGKKEKLISVVLAVYNEEKNLDACLASVAPFADEIVVVDGGSSDGTVDIAKKHHAKVIQTDNPSIFHINKQKALDEATCPWILQLDADEVVPYELAQEIRRICAKKTAHNGYYIPRKNFFLGKWLSKGGQYPDYVIRLVRKNYAHFPAKSVHEQIHVLGSAGYLTHPLLHYTNRTLRNYWRKAHAYTSLTADEMAKKNVGKNPYMFFVYMCAKPFWTFVMLFFRHKGCIDGAQGFLFALFSGLHHPIAYWKYLTTKS